MENQYALVKHLHLIAVTLSISLFIVRATWMAWSPSRLQQRWVKIVPHVVDTALLLSGVWLAWQLGAEGVRAWLPAKLAGLFAYIVLGNVALKRGRTPRIRIAAAIGALASVVYIIAVAITKSPLVLFGH